MKKLLSALFAISTLSSVAGSQTDSLPTYRLEGIVVTATRTPLALKDAPIITRVIEMQDAQREGIVNIQTLLERELAGVEFHQAGYGTSLSFQGLDARYVLFLVDGERMAGETYGNVDYSRIPMNIVDRIEIIRGASSVLYGSNAMGAVVNIITKRPAKKVELSASVKYGTLFQNNRSEELAAGTANGDLNIYRNNIDLPNMKNEIYLGLNLGKFSSQTALSLRMSDAYRISGTRDESRHYDSLQTMKVGNMTSMPPSFLPDKVVRDTTVNIPADARGLSVSGWKDLNLWQRLDYEPNDKFRFELSGSYFDKARYDFKSSIMDDNPLSGLMPGRDWTFETYSGYNGKFVMEHSPNSRNKIYLSMVRDEYFRNVDSLSNGVSTRKQRHTYNNPRMLWTLDAGVHRLTTGVEMLNERLHFDLNPRGYDDLKSITTGSLYIQDEILSGRDLSFVVGLRGDVSNRFDGRVTPKASVKYNLGRFTLRGNYSSGYRTPSLKEMYMTLDIPIPGSPKIVGNENLKPETNQYLSASAEYTHGRFNLSTTWNKSYYRNKIDVRGRSEGGTTIMQYENINESRFGSIEFIGRVLLGNEFVLRGNYNYVYQSDDAPESSTQYIYTSPHTATLGADYRFKVGGVKIFLNGNARFVGAKEYRDFMPYINFPQALLDYIQNPTFPPPPPVLQAMREFKYFSGSYSARHDAYAVCNASVNAQFGENIGLTIGVDNIFDYRPAVVNFNSAILPGVSGFAQLTVNF